MADLLNLLNTAATTLKPLIGGLNKTGAGAQPVIAAAKSQASGAVKNLSDFVAAAPTQDDVDADTRSAVIASVHSALVEVQIQAQTNPASVSQAKALLVDTIVTNLEQEQAVLELAQPLRSIKNVLGGLNLDHLNTQLQGAGLEIASRTQAKDILDTVVNLLIVAGQLATKLV